MENRNLGFCPALSDKIDCDLELLNESVIQILKQNQELKSIKKVVFSINEDVKKINVSITFRSGNSVEEEFLSYYDHGAISLCKNEIIAYFGEPGISKVTKYLEDEELSGDFLQAHEPELYSQLVVIYMLGCTPNTMMGGEFTDRDKEFFLSAIAKYSN